MESNYDIINDLGDQGRLFRVGESATPATLVPLVPGDGDERAWSGLDYGPEAVVAGVEDYSGHTHEWRLAEPVTTVSEYSYVAKFARLYGATVYEIGQEWGGPEEGGWWYDTYHPIACVLADDDDDEADAAYEAAMAWVLLDHEDGMDDGSIQVIREAVIGGRTTVGRSYYC